MGNRRALPRFAAILLAALGGCGQPEPIRLGFVSGITGRHANLGISSRAGVQLAVSEINAAGGIGGRPIDLLIRDDEQQPEAARAAVEDLVRQGVVAIIGHATSSMAEATLPIVDREKVLMVSPTVSSAAFLGKDDWFIMLHPSTAESARTMAEWLARKGIARRVAILYDLSNRAYTQSWHDHFSREHAGRGGAIAASIPFTSGEVARWSELARSALAGAPDAVLVIANALDSAALAQQLRKLRPGLQLLGTEWGFTNEILSHGGTAVEGAIYMQKVDVTSRAPDYVRFREAFERRFHRDVDFAAILAYETAQVVAEGLRRSPTRAGIREAILGHGAFRGLQGDFTIDRFGDVKRPHIVMSVRGGAMARLD